MRTLISQKTADLAGVILSQLCLVHCLLLPLLVGFLPSFSCLEALGGEAFHLGALSLTTPVVLFALFQGYRNHASSVPVKFGGASLILLWVVFFSEEALPHDVVPALNVMGGLLMAWAHWQNWSFTKEKACC